jgi:hypothetical protein
LHREVSWKLTYVSEVRTASIVRAVVLEKVSAFETLVNLCETTWRAIPEDSGLRDQTALQRPRAAFNNLSS